MTFSATQRRRNPNLEGAYAIRGSYRLVQSTGAVTTIAAATATAGFLFSWQWSPAVANAAVKGYLRYVGAKFILSTAYTTAQETAMDMIIARSYTVAATGGTAIDVGGTVTGSGKFQTSQASSLVNDCRIATASALTAGTQTLDANPVGLLSDFSSAIGATIPSTSSGAGSGWGTLFDARDEQTPFEFSTNEGFILRNKVLMGAVGIGRWDVCIEWDEGTPLRA